MTDRTAAEHPSGPKQPGPEADWPSRRAGLRDDIAAAIEAADYSGSMRRGDLADSVMPVLYREWPWLRAEADEAGLTDPEVRAQLQAVIKALGKSETENRTLRAKVAEFDHIINWHTTCASCARILDSAYAETVRAETAEAAVERVRAAVHIVDADDRTDWQRGYRAASERALAILNDDQATTIASCSPDAAETEPNNPANWYEAGCARDCTEQHTYTWGRCALATESARPDPTVSMSVVYDDTDGHKSIGFDTYTVAGLADLIEPALNEGEDGFAKPYDYGRWLAEKAAKAIVHRNDKPEPEKEQP